MENSGLTYGMSVTDVIVTIGVIGGIMNERCSHDKNRLEWGRDTSTLSWVTPTLCRAHLCMANSFMSVGYSARLARVS